MMFWSLLLTDSPEFTGGVFSYVIQGGSFVALLIGGYLFAKHTAKREERNETRLDALADRHATTVERLGTNHAQALKAVTDLSALHLERLTSDSAANRKTFEGEMARYRHEGNGRESRLLLKLAECRGEKTSAVRQRQADEDAGNDQDENRASQ